MADDRPVDVRLAEAMGCVLSPYRAVADYIPDGSLFTCSCDEHRGNGPFALAYSSDYAWCGEVQHLNDLSVKTRWIPSGRMYYVDVDGALVSYEHGESSRLKCILGMSNDPRIATCEWVIAAIAAGVRVVLPGGRVING